MRSVVRLYPGPPTFCRLDHDAGWSSPVARWAHNPKVAGSNPAPATNLITIIGGVAQLAERGLCKPEVRSSSLLTSTIVLRLKLFLYDRATRKAVSATKSDTRKSVRLINPPEVEHSKEAVC